MLRRSTIAIATVKSSVAVAGSFPNWDVTASCRGAASAGSNQTPRWEIGKLSRERAAAI